MRREPRKRARGFPVEINLEEGENDGSENIFDVVVWHQFPLPVEHALPSCDDEATLRSWNVLQGEQDSRTHG